MRMSKAIGCLAAALVLLLATVAPAAAASQASTDYSTHVTQVETLVYTYTTCGGLPAFAILQIGASWTRDSSEVTTSWASFDGQSYGTKCTGGVEAQTIAQDITVTYTTNTIGWARGLYWPASYLANGIGLGTVFTVQTTKVMYRNRGYYSGPCTSIALSDSPSC
jgi:hypothetical protein